MKKFFALLVMVALVFLGLPTVAQATEKVPHKSYVCKYVGKPGVNERLQTGNNPIWVDNHAIAHTDYVNNGDEFKDAHGRSVVIYANVGKMNPEPTVADCPPADVPVVDEPPVDEPPVTPPTPEPVLTPVKPYVDVVNWCGFDRDRVKGSFDERYTSVTVRESRSTWVTTFTAAPGYKIVGDNPVVTVPSIFDCPVVKHHHKHKHVKCVKHHHKHHAHKHKHKAKKHHKHKHHRHVKIVRVVLVKACGCR